MSQYGYSEHLFFGGVLEGVNAGQIAPDLLFRQPVE